MEHYLPSLLRSRSALFVSEAWGFFQPSRALSKLRLRPETLKYRVGHCEESLTGLSETCTFTPSILHRPGVFSLTEEVSARHYSCQHCPESSSFESSPKWGLSQREVGSPSDGRVVLAEKGRGSCLLPSTLARFYSSQHSPESLLKENRNGREQNSRSDQKVVDAEKGLDSVSDESEHRASSQKHAGASGRSTSEDVIAVDRSGLQKEPVHQHGQVPGKEEEAPLAKHLKALIRFRGGPITIAEYMKEVLTNPKDGFYMRKDVFGAKGDFVTSPDISQMFGELMGIWAVVLWQQMGQPKEVNLVELGPGRGALMADLLRGTAQFREFTSCLRVHLVEVSPALRELQRSKLQCQVTSATASKVALNTSSASEHPNDSDQRAPSGGLMDSLSGPFVSRISDVPVWWHSELEEVPAGSPLIVIGHEFLDALPVHQFQRTQLGWCERLVDIAPDWSQRHLRLVLSKGPTVATKLYLKQRLEWLSLHEQRDNQVIEVCPGAIDLAKELAKRIGDDGGGALLIDYGDDKLAGDSLQAIKQHKFVDLLHAPGTADLSAWVDFAAFKRAAEESGADVRSYGPLSQTQLLAQLGINARVEALLENATEEEAQSLEQAYLRLVGDQPGDEAARKPPGMGAKYKAVAIAKKDQGPPFPFT